MNITLCSAFRNADAYLDRYLDQVTDLRQRLVEQGDRLFCVWGEGDSVDDTQSRLWLAAKYCGWPVHIVDCTHGGPDYPSIVLADRFVQLAHVGNTIWRAVPKGTDAVLFVESDLLWEAETMLALLAGLKSYPAICPKILLRRRGWPAHAWYDTWAFRKNGQHFGHHPPYVEGVSLVSYTQIDSGGSCMAIRGELARKVNFPNEDVFVGLSRQLYEQGGSLWLDGGLTVTHL